MLRQIQLTGEPTSIEIPYPEACPICKQHSVPEFVMAARYQVLFYDNDYQHVLAVFSCFACRQAFLAQLLLDEASGLWSITRQEPTTPTRRRFDTRILAISDRFVEVYHQAQAAETYQLYELAALGYRKALEFLARDYALFRNPEEAESIKRGKLSICLEHYFDHPKIKESAKSAEWLTTDKALFNRIWQEQDMIEIKRLLHACLFWLQADLEAEPPEPTSPTP